MTPAERAAAIASQARSERDEQTRRNRERAPEFAAFVDELRRVFGKVKVRRFEVFGKEGSR